MAKYLSSKEAAQVVLEELINPVKVVLREAGIQNRISKTRWAGSALGAAFDSFESITELVSILMQEEANT